MNNSPSLRYSPSLRFDELNWVADAPLPRDQQQSHRLHEPDYLLGTIDPITGNDVDHLDEHPSVVDGKLTIYFESEATRQEFLNTPVNHPYEHGLGKSPEDADRGG
jgi:YHS domain-containing protein